MSTIEVELLWDGEHCVVHYKSSNEGCCAYHVGRYLFPTVKKPSKQWVCYNMHVHVRLVHQDPEIHVHVCTNGKLLHVLSWQPRASKSVV